MASSVGDLVVNISADLASLYTGMAEAADLVTKTANQISAQFKTAASNVGDLTDAIKGVAAAAGVGLSIAGIASFTESVVSAAAQLERLSNITGSSVESLSQLANVAQYSGVSFDTVQKLIDHLAAVLGGFASQSKQAQGALQELGIATTDPVDAFNQLAIVLNQYADGANKVGLVTAIFGRQAAQLIPVLTQVAEAQGIAATTSTDQAQAALQLTQQIALLEIQSTTFKDAILSGVVPALLGAVSAFNAAHQAGLGFFGSLAIGFGVDASNVGFFIQKVRDDLVQLNVQMDNIKAAQAADSKNWDDYTGAISAQAAAIQTATEKLATYNAIQAQTVLSRPGLSGPATYDARDYQAQYKPQAPRPPPAAPKGVDPYTSAMADLTKQAALAQQAVDAVFSGQVVTDADKFLATLENNKKAWDSISPSQQAIIKGTAEYVSQQEQASAETTAAAKGYEELATAQAALQKAQSDGVVKTQTEALKQQMADAKTLYDQGAIDFETYYATITEDQKESLAIQLGALNDALTAQENVLSVALQKNAQYATNVGDQLAAGTITWTQAQLDLAHSGAEVVKAQTGVATAQNAVNLALQQGKTIGSDYLAQWEAANSDIDSTTQALKKQTDAQNLANDAIGLTAQQYQLLIVQKQADQLASLQSLSLDDATVERVEQVQKAIAALKDQIAQRTNLAASLGDAQQLQQISDGWKSLFQSASNEGATFIENFVTHGSSAFKTLWSDFLTWALDSFAKIAANQIVIQIAGSIGLGTAATNALAGSSPVGSVLSGGSALQTLFGGSSGVGGVSGIMDSALSLFGAGSNAFSAAVATSGIALSAGTAAVGGLATALGAMATVAIPVVGVIVAAAAAFGLFGSHGGPKVGGSASNIPGVGFYPGETGTAGNTASSSLLTTTQSGYAAALAALGGSGSAQFALGFDTDPQGTAGNRVSGAATVNGKQVFNQLDVGAGTDQTALTAGLSLEAQRAVLAALQASSLPEYLTHLLDTVTASSASSADITALETTAESVATLSTSFAKLMDPAQVVAFTTALDGIDFTKSTDAIKSVAEAAFQILDPAMVSVVDAFQGTDTDLATFVATLATISAGTAGLGDAVKANIDAALADGTQATATKVLAFVQILDSGATSFASIEAPLQSLSATQIPAFIDALGGAANALSAMSYIYTNFTTTAQKTQDATTTLNADFAALGIAVPQTHQAFLALLADTDPSSPLYASIVNLAPLFVQVHGTADQAATALSAVSTSLAGVASAASQIVVSSGSLINAGISMANSQLASFATIANESPGDFGAQLGIQIGLINDAIKAASPDQFTSGIAFTAYTNELQSSLATMSDQLGRFTVLSAQYGSSIAQQLVALEDWNTQQQNALHGNAAALTALASVYNDKWNSIVSGTATAVSGVQNALTSLQQSIAAYLQSLVVGTLSPLTPQQQIAQAQQAYDQQLALGSGANASTLTADANTLLTLERGAFASSQAYTNIFDQITTQLGDLAGTQQTGAPATAAVLPTVLNTPSLPPGVAGSLTTAGGVTSGIATSDDIAQLATSLGVRIGDLEQTVAAVLANVAASATSDANRIIAGGQSDAVAVVDGLGGSLK